MSNLRILSLLPLGRRILMYPNKLPPVTVCSSTTIRTLNYEQKRGYKKFGHKPEVDSVITNLFCMFCLTALFGCMVDWRWCRMLFMYYTGQLKDKSIVENDANAAKKET